MYPVLEELTLNAWVGDSSVLFDGWVLSFSNGYSRRANSVNPVYASTLPLPDKIAACEQIYTERGRETIFKICSPAPSELDTLLAQRGYETVAHTSVQVADRLPTHADTGVALWTRAEERWLDAMCALSATPSAYRSTMASMLDKIVPAHAFASLSQEGVVVAVGLAVLERGYVGLFDIVVDPAVRNQGVGRRLVSALLHWGQQLGAERGWLAVMSDNAPALALYGKLGYREVYQYWYRVMART